jgi:hypothetical protein
MQLINGSKSKIRCADGEVITVAVAPNAGVGAVRYSLDGEKWTGGSFPVNQKNPPISSDSPRRALSIGVVYNGDSGGKATITITGSGGGESSVLKVEQSPKTDTQEAEVLDMPLYRFYI